MKKILLGSLVAFGLAASSSVFAADTEICTGAAQAGNGAVPTSGNAGTTYMMTGIKPKCSANVWLSGMDGTSGAWYAVGSASVKGKTTFKGHTNGGAVSKNVDCAIPGGCTQAEAQAAKTAANTQASSS